MSEPEPRTDHPTRALVHLDRLGRNVALLRELARGRPLWPAVKANAYGHGMALVARHLVGLGCETLCVAHASEALELRAAGIGARLLVMVPALPEEAAQLVEPGLEPVVCTAEAVEALSSRAEQVGRPVPVHVMVDTGMGRVGIRPEDVEPFLARCADLPGVRVRGLMSHFPRADEADASFSRRQIDAFDRVCAATREAQIEVCHMANSAAIFDLPGSHLDAVRPGISIYGLAPSAEIANPRVRELEPVLEWKTRITFLKEVPSGVGLSYGHTFRTERPSLIATLPVGYADGLLRGLSNRLEVLVGGTRCPQVGTVTMDQILVDVTALRGRVAPGDEVVLIGSQGRATIRADEWARKLDTIVYEVVTSIGPRVPRIALGAAVEGDRA